MRAECGRTAAGAQGTAALACPRGLAGVIPHDEVFPLVMRFCQHRWGGRTAGGGPRGAVMIRACTRVRRLDIRLSRNDGHRTWRRLMREGGSESGSALSHVVETSHGRHGLSLTILCCVQRMRRPRLDGRNCVSSPAPSRSDGRQLHMRARARPAFRQTHVPGRTVLMVTAGRGGAAVAPYWYNLPVDTREKRRYSPLRSR